MRGGVVIEVALVVGEEGSEAVGASEVEVSEDGDAGEGKTFVKCCRLLLVSLARRFVGRIPSCM